MRGQQSLGAEEKKSADGEASMNEIWSAAAKAFESICGESLQKGEVKSFDDLQKKIENSSNPSFDTDAGPRDSWDKAKGVGLKSLKYMKMLLGAASQASSFIAIPSAAASITTSALGFVFDIPQSIKDYNDAVNEVFEEVSSALSQFQIYGLLDNIDPLLVKQIHLVLISFVKVCAHVVKYRQGSRGHRFRQKFKSIFEDDSGLASEMAEFRRSLQGQRDVQGTVTLAVVVDTQQDVAEVLENLVVFNKITEQTQQTVQETHRGVQALKDDSDRTKTLVKIRDSLRVPSTVRLDGNTTKTCTNILDRCIYGTGSWIWTHDAYLTWIALKDKDKVKDTSHILIVSGPPSSGKTSVTALITRSLEEQKERTFVAHYFFTPNAKKSDGDKNPVQSAIKYMAFQIARVDATVRKALGKACDTAPHTSHENLDTLWRELKIGGSGSGATYYLVFDGLENLPDKQVQMLLEFAFGSQLTGDSAGRVRILMSMTNEQFASNGLALESALRIQMEQHNVPDMRLVIDDALNKQGMLQHVKTNSEQQKAREKIIEKLPQNVSGSYSLMQFGLDDIIRLLSTRTAVQELDRMLDQSINSHEAAIQSLQRSLTADEIAELNELLKWVLRCYNPTLDQLEAAMWLYSGIASITPLEYIIKNKYSAVLKVEEGCVYAQDGVLEYLQKKMQNSSIHASQSNKDHTTISMTITINNVEQELCGHFLWDLADMAIRDRFRFNLSGDGSHALQSSRGAIAVDKFEATHTIVARAFECLSREPRSETENIAEYLIYRLPHFLNRLRQLEDEDKGALTPHQQFEIGQHLYNLFKDDTIFRQHKSVFEKIYWTAHEMRDLQKWLRDSAVVRKLDKKWRTEVEAANPTRGYLKGLVKLVVAGLLRERSWDVSTACWWLMEFMAADQDEKKTQQPSEPPSSSSDASSSGIDWDSASTWCQGFLELAESDLDSLWYERLAAISSFLGQNSDQTLSLYQRAIELKDPSWMCFRGLGETYYKQARRAEAIVQMDLAIEAAGQESAVPKPEPKDIFEMNLLEGKYAYEVGDMLRAAEHYRSACSSDDVEQAIQGQLGLLKAKLCFTDPGDTRLLLKTTLAQEGGEDRMVRVLKMVARDADHDTLIPNMFAMAKDDPGLMKAIVHTMRVATSRPTTFENRITTETFEEEEDRFAADEARGVLLYDLGVAAYTYKVASEDIDPVSEALRLWTESRDQLAKIGGINASVTRSNATSALANHYFQCMMDESHSDHLEALEKLAKDDVYTNESVGFLGYLYAQRGDKEKARAVLAPQLKQALQILSDDMPENDLVGFSTILRIMVQYQDFKNAAIALSLLGQQDLVAGALFFEAGDILRDDGEGDDEDDPRVLEIVTKLAEETVQLAKSQVPDSANQTQRIKAAKTHIDSLIATAAQTKPTIAGPEADNEDGGDATTTAYRLIESRLTMLAECHLPEIDFTIVPWSWGCDGRTADGKPCKNVADFSNEFYHCMYCSNRDFCQDCFKRLHGLEPDLITVCSPKHRWLRFPRQGEDVYVGSGARIVPVPSGVKPVEGNEQVMKAFYGEEGPGETLTIEVWKEKIAQEWGISLQEIMDGISTESEEEEVEIHEE